MSLPANGPKAIEQSMASIGDVRLKQRAVIEFLTAEGCAPINIHRRLTAVYGDACVDVSTVRRWARTVKDQNPAASNLHTSHNLPQSEITARCFNRTSSLDAMDCSITLEREEIRCGNEVPRRPLCPLFQIPEGGCTEPPSSVTCEDLRCEQYNQTCCSRACGAKFCFGVQLDDD
ncbi:hypothetical protein HPB49_020997 [Dermacentor silvarum]|uniref:Uncharacterized protein n=1 Tax=Dermacentor silvarum TaxID=543639 RepID=A0ACB8E325_DERSI|nr:hypothetical protein HPB49_020997 [Dermacentor silvarum]